MAAPLQACVLHQYDWSESSLILDLFTREQGRVAVAAKGAKRPHSNFRPVLLPFQRLLVSLGRAGADGGEIQTLRSAEWAGGRPMLAGGALFAGFYLNELLMRLLARQDPHPRLFDAYIDSLGHLTGIEDADSQAALRAFEFVLLREIGVLPELDRDTQTQEPLTSDHAYQLQAEGLHRTSLAPASLGGDAWARIAQALEDDALTPLREACRPVLPALRSQLRQCLHYHLGSSTLRTRQVMLDVQKLVGRDAEPAPDAPASSRARTDR